MRLTPFVFALLMAGNCFAQAVKKIAGETNGAIYSIITDAKYIYVGGEFTRVVDPGKITGGIGSADLVTGTALSLPSINGKVYTISTDGNNGWFIGGDFTIPNESSIKNIAHLNADLQLDTNWKFIVNGPVRCMVLRGNSLMIGGEFTTINSSTRNRLASLSISGNLEAFHPDVNNAVWSLAVSGNNLIVGGFFTTISGQVRNNLAMVNLTNGQLEPWNPNCNGSVLSLLTMGNDVIVGGVFTTLAGQSRNNLAKLSTQNGSVDTQWKPSPNGSVTSIATMGNDIYFGGSFTQINGSNIQYLAKVAKNGPGELDNNWMLTPNGPVSTLSISGNSLVVGGNFKFLNTTSCPNLAKINLNTKAVETWDTGSNGPIYSVSVLGSKVILGGEFSFVGGMSRNNLARFSKSSGELDVTWNPGANGRVQSMALTNGALVVGGLFNQLNGINRNRLGMIDLQTGNVLSWNPNVNGIIASLAVDHQHIYFGGTFTQVGILSRANIARASLATGEIDPSWKPEFNNSVRSISINNTFVLVAGDFTLVNNLSRRFLTRIGKDGSVESWDARVSGPVYTQLTDGNNLFIGGSFSQVNQIGRDNIAKLNLTTGAVDPLWNPMANGSVRAMTGTSQGLVVAGNFNAIGGETRNGLVKLLSNGLASQTWAPKPGNDVFTVWKDDGFIIIGGVFTMVDDNNSFNLAAIQSVPRMELNINLNAVNAGDVIGFGSINVLDKKDELLVIKNSGEAPLQISDLKITGTSFVIEATTFPLTINESESKNVKIIFQPTTSGNFSSTLSIISNNDSPSTYSLTLSGNAKKLNQTISFDPLPEKNSNDAPFTLTASTTSKLPITFTSSDESIVSISGNLATLKRDGEVVITATQNGNDVYESASPIARTLKVNVVTGIEAAESIRIFPNPVKDQLTLHLSEGLINNVQILDITGKKWGHWQITTSSTLLDLESLPAGIYFINVANEHGNLFYQKVMKH